MAQISFQSLLPTFIQDLEKKGRSPSTILAYRADLEQLLEYLANKAKAAPDQVVQADIETFRDTLLTQKYTPKSVSRKLNAVKPFFRWLISEKHSISNPTENVAHPKIEPALPKFLSPIEYRALRDVVRDDPRIGAIVELILQTGMRISEVANMKLVNLRDSEVVVEAYATQPQRTVPLNKPANKRLKYLSIQLTILGQRSLLKI
ncbi:MAG: Site-specific tyrosine recombinase XerD [Candidatus Woesebacteria bacterium GW2011_GWA1_39_8]|uniref:Site-specific tyrosine recombinase XerD n=1 Tax=Candidatus Woesebacteria bacterium GW2011_GWA1_39_8 TaxID=1618552 RepID=A0A0G0PR12_9BACT|nr:MAG: Site-specific tyrosine recombinase XerD [Candidatus Woesebacteria bacterium GW2011_GWA1_39_8]